MIWNINKNKRVPGHRAILLLVFIMPIIIYLHCEHFKGLSIRLLKSSKKRHGKGVSSMELPLILYQLNSGSKTHSVKIFNFVFIIAAIEIHILNTVHEIKSTDRQTDGHRRLSVGIELKTKLNGPYLA